MPLNISTEYVVNEKGELLVEAGTGTDNIAERLPEGYVPVNLTTGKMLIKFPAGIGGGGSSLFKATGVLPNATPVVVALGSTVPATAIYRVSVNPTSGDTVTVESGTSSTGPWTAWPNGPITSPNFADIYPGAPAITHVRFTRSAGSSATSRYYINETTN